MGELCLLIAPIVPAARWCLPRLGKHPDGRSVTAQLGCIVAHHCRRGPMTPRVRAVILTDYVEVARSVGLDPYAMLRDKQLVPRHLQDPEWSLSAVPVVSLLEESAIRSECLEFGILMAKCRTYASLGPLSLLLQHVPTPRDVLASGKEYRHLINDIITLREESRDGVTLLKCGLDCEGAGFQTMSLYVAVLFTVLRNASGGAWHPDCVHFTNYRPNKLRPFTEYFSQNVEFESDFDGFSCSQHLLDIANPLADERMAHNARTLLDALPEKARVRTFIEQTRHAISLMIGSEPPTLTTVSRNLGMSARSLQRLLMDEGSSFSELLKATRRDLVIRYVNTSSLPLSIIAEMVGFSDGSTFSRWFSREFGESPLSWRSKRSHLQASGRHRLH